jgi:hypothetical protein
MKGAGMPLLHHARRLLLAALISVSALCAIAGAAPAERLVFGESTFRVAWTPMRFVFEGLITISCNATLEGSFHSRTIAKVERSLIGYVTRASLSACSEPGVTVLGETLPWHLQYASFAGTLPNISSVRLRLIGASVSSRISGFSCLARTEANAPAILRANRGEAGTITSIGWEEGASIPLTGCLGARGRLEGTSSSVTGAGNTRAITLALGGAPVLSPSPVEFGRVAPEAVVARAVTIHAGEAVLEVRSIAVRSGANVAILDPNRCVGSRLSTGVGCIFKAIFAAPRETERTFEDTITVVTSAGTLEDAVRAST